MSQPEEITTKFAHVKNDALREALDALQDGIATENGQAPTVGFYMRFGLVLSAIQSEALTDPKELRENLSNMKGKAQRLAKGQTAVRDEATAARGELENLIVLLSEAGPRQITQTLRTSLTSRAESAITRLRAAEKAYASEYIY